MNIKIYQGKQTLEKANVNVVIDVIRAFTVSHQAFLAGIDEIHLLNTIEDGMAFKQANKHCILSGEVNAYKIPEFDLGNSPYNISQLDLKDKKLGQKTTNGVSVTLQSLNADHVIVTGFSNANATAKYIKTLYEQFEGNEFIVNLIASHPTGDEDVACAEYIKHLLLENYDSIQVILEDVVHRILRCDAAQKFIEVEKNEFSILDLVLCMTSTHEDFVMKIDGECNDINPVIKKEELCMD